MADSSFYNSGNMDLKYLEIGIALSRIDRMRPGKIPFCIPVLTPTLNQNDKQESTIVQQSKTNIVTKNANAVEVSNLNVSNYIEIEIPRELTCLPDPTYDIKGEVIVDGLYTLDNGTHTITIQGNVDVSGSGDLSGRAQLSGDVDGLSYDDAYTLFHSRYESDRNNPWKDYK